MISPLQTRDSISLSFFPSVLPLFLPLLPSSSFIVLSSSFLLCYLPDIFPSPLLEIYAVTISASRTRISIYHACMCLCKRARVHINVRKYMHERDSSRERGIPSLISIRAKRARWRKKDKQIEKLEDRKGERERETGAEKLTRKEENVLSDGNETGRGRRKREE